MEPPKTHYLAAREAITRWLPASRWSFPLFRRDNRTSKLKSVGVSNDPIFSKKSPAISVNNPLISVVTSKVILRKRIFLQLKYSRDACAVFTLAVNEQIFIANLALPCTKTLLKRIFDDLFIRVIIPCSFSLYNNRHVAFREAWHPLTPYPR